MNGDVFLKAGILTLIVFLVGMFFGIWLDQLRIEELRWKLEEIFIAWEDSKLQNIYYQTFKLQNCELAIKQNLEFSDKVYYGLGKMIEEYERVNKFYPELMIEKKKYVLLKLQFWFNSVYLKEKCNASYVNVVYFYSQFADLVTKENQKVQSLVLAQIKEEYGNKILLIPLPLDMNITSIEAIANSFNITTSPTILIDEKIKLEGLQKKEDLKKIIESLLS
ncbi:MAG: hypothetical protein QXX38_02375 [Candidatus Aenigmatarchaeota archaeon]